MYGVRGAGAGGWIVLALGATAAAVALGVLRPRLKAAAFPVATAEVALVLTAAALPFLAWRIVQDLRVTTGLDAYAAAAAGPIQAYLPGYLVDGAQRRIPVGATYATVVSPAVPWPAARAAFPSLAMETLFPRVSVADPRRAGYVLTWGLPPPRVVRVSRWWVVRPRAGEYAAVYVGEVRR